MSSWLQGLFGGFGAAAATPADDDKKKPEDAEEPKADDAEAEAEAEAEVEAAADDEPEAAEEEQVEAAAEEEEEAPAPEEEEADEPAEEEEDDGQPKQAALEDSNIAGIGSEEDHALRKAAAASDPEFKNAGTKVGIEIWRVENKRTDADTPDFGIKRWSKDNYGSFYTGDSYIILNTYRPKDPVTGKERDSLAWDLHFWLGRETSQDEKGVAAYKTVELDDLLDDGPIQYRETQFNESKLFQSYFKEIVYLDGGIASGFRAVKPEEYAPRLFMVRSTGKTTRAFQVPVSAANLNNGDCFVLDTGLKVYRFLGEDATFFERNKSGLLQSNLVSSRNGKAVKADIDDDFWAVLDGSPEDVKEANADDVFLPDEIKQATDLARMTFDPSSLKLFRISDASGKVEFTLEAESGAMPYEALDSEDCFLVNTNVGLWVWLGAQSSRQEKSKSMAFADQYIADEGLPSSIPVMVLREETAVHNHFFTSMFKF